MNEDIEEKWVDVPQSQYHKRTICQVSNTGKYKRNNGEIGVLTKCQFTHRPEQIIFSHFIAEYFLITVRRPDQNCIDHITHTPREYHVNDVRNLRWCTRAENSRFAEAVDNRNKSGKWHPSGSDSPTWKGENAGPRVKYRRALSMHRAGIISASELKKYRDAYSQYKKERSKK